MVGPHLRCRDADGEYESIKRVRLKPHYRPDNAKFRHQFNISHEVEDHIANARSHERCKERSPSLPFAEASKKGRIEKEINEQLLEIEIIAIPKLRDRS